MDRRERRQRHAGRGVRRVGPTVGDGRLRASDGGGTVKSRAVFVISWMQLTTARVGVTSSGVPRALLVFAAIAWLVAVSVAAQAPQTGRGRLDPGVERLRAFDPAAVERGRSAFGEKCSACH